jgi:pimeloyl-ACP methyl ester carboxylesterase
MEWGFNHPGVSSPPDSAGEEVLVALHGLGGCGAVWGSVLEHQPGRWPAWWSAPDLAGHGVGPRLASYTFDGMARALARSLPPAGSYVVVGHSLGGVVALRLAALEPRVRRVVGVGIKVEWTDDELARAAELARRPVAWFDTQVEAVARFRRVSGVGDLLDDAYARRGVVEEAGRWRLAFDPGTFGVGRPDMAALVRECTAEVVLARGEHDPMNTDGQLRALVPTPVTLAGLGHHAHLEDPDAVCALL